MPLRGDKWAGVFGRLGTYLQGEVPLQLTPVAGGDPVPFNHDGIVREIDDGPAPGVIVKEMIRVSTQTPLALNADYDWDGKRWQAWKKTDHRVGAGRGPHHYVLVCHAK